MFSHSPGTDVVITALPFGQSWTKVNSDLHVRWTWLLATSRKHMLKCVHCTVNNRSKWEYSKDITVTWLCLNCEVSTLTQFELTSKISHWLSTFDHQSCALWSQQLKNSEMPQFVIQKLFMESFVEHRLCNFLLSLMWTRSSNSVSKGCLSKSNIITWV